MFSQAVNAKISATAAAANKNLWVVLRDILTSLTFKRESQRKTETYL